MKRRWLIIGLVVLALILCCCVVLIVTGAAYQLLRVRGTSQPAGETTPTVSATPLPILTQPTIMPDDAVSADNTKSVLEGMNVPINNYYDLAARLLGKENVPLTLPAPVIQPAVNDNQKFWVNNTDTHETFQVSTTLQYVTPHVYFWVEDDIRFNKTDLKNLANTFENKIYPTDREFFGSEWTPGVDNDPHIYILMVKNVGVNLAGYFSSSDEYNPEVHKYSNAHEMFILSGDNANLKDKYTYGVLAHEFQHMIHWYDDLNEESWLNEGFSELAVLLNGYDLGGFPQSYISNPDMQLTDWATDVGANSPHYGGSFLFVTYFLSRFGEDATKALIALPENGMSSIDKVLSNLHEIDPATNNTMTADNFFSDWVVTNYLNNPKVQNGQFHYDNYPAFSTASWTNQIDSCPSEIRSDSVFQYGVDYIYIDCGGSHTLEIQGKPFVRILNTDAKSGKYAFWSNKGDESDMTLTREFDFSNVTGPLTLDYSTWYSLEQDFDYAYVEISEDGRNWTILDTPHGTDKDLSGNSYGWGYNGTSNGWLDESVDLSSYASKKIRIRFEYITDAAVTWDGLLLDDISIPEIQYSENFEQGDGGWTGAGFVRMDNQLPQTYALNLILTDHGKTTVTRIVLDSSLHAEIPLDLSGGKTAVLTVSGTTRFTNQPAIYTYSVK
jgi:immune inhibitor A